MKARLYQKYVESVLPALMEKRKYQNVHQVPRIEKIVINMGVSAQLEKSAVDDATRDLGPAFRAVPSTAGAIIRSVFRIRRFSRKLTWTKSNGTRGWT